MTDTPKECRTCGMKEATVLLRNGASVLCCPACYYRDSGCLEAGIVAKNCRIRELESAALATDAQLAELQAERAYFMQEIYEFGCRAMTEDRVDARKRALGFVWQRVCILKDAIKHGCRQGIELTPTSGTAAEE